MLQAKTLQQFPFHQKTHTPTSILEWFNLYTSYFSLTFYFSLTCSSLFAIHGPGHLHIPQLRACSLAVPFARKALPPDIPLAGSFLHLHMSAQKSSGHHLKHSTGTPHVLLLLFFHSTFTISALSHILRIVCFPY